jgi:hypothetical protein
MIVDSERASWGIKSVDAYERTTRRGERGRQDGEGNSRRFVVVVSVKRERANWLHWSTRTRLFRASGRGLRQPSNSEAVETRATVQDISFDSNKTPGLPNITHKMI